MAVTVDEADLRALLEVAEEARRLPPTEESVTDILGLLARVVGADRHFWNRTQTAPTPRWIGETSVPAFDVWSHFTPEVVDEWWRRRREHPVMSGAHGPVVAVSDVVRSGWHETWLYNECFRPTGMEHEMGVHLSHPAGQIHVVWLSRSAGSDFDEKDHLLLRLLRPHLDAAFARVGLEVPKITSREVEVLRLVREGLTNQQIARRLLVRPTTVAKHLEHLYARTGSRSRVQVLETYRAALD